MLKCKVALNSFGQVCIWQTAVLYDSQFDEQAQIFVQCINPVESTSAESCRSEVFGLKTKRNWKKKNPIQSLLDVSFKAFRTVLAFQLYLIQK